jgi:NitT/TauT family transport system ATP-binding protein
MTQAEPIRDVTAIPLPDASSAGELRISGVSKTFPASGKSAPTVVLDRVDLDVAAGEFVCLLGPSGCGKSTLLNIVAGFLPADEGGVTAGGRPVRGPGPDRCVLFQSPTLFPWLTTRDNVLFGPRARRAVDAETRETCDRLLDAVGLGSFAGHYPHQLSGGMRHRAALARALINQPAVLLMDEPFGALDAITRAAMQAFLLDLWQRHRMTVLFVTHDVEEATLLADRVCVMSARPGRILQVVDVDMARPRSYEMTETTAFIRMKRTIRELVEEGMRSE